METITHGYGQHENQPGREAVQTMPSALCEVKWNNIYVERSLVNKIVQQSRASSISEASPRLRCGGFH